MTQYAGVIRVPKYLENAYNTISNISQEQILESSVNLKDYFETLNIRLLSLVLLKCMNERKESRGGLICYLKMLTLWNYIQEMMKIGHIITLL